MTNLIKPIDGTDTQLPHSSSVLVVIAAPARERTGFIDRLGRMLDRVDAVGGAILRAVGHAVLEGFAAYGAAEHGYVLSAHTGARGEQPFEWTKPSDRGQAGRFARGYGRARLMRQTADGRHLRLVAIADGDAPAATRSAASNG